MPITERSVAFIGDENASCAPASSKWSSAMQRRSIRPTPALEVRIVQHAKSLSEQTQMLRPGPSRDDLIRKARQADIASHMQEWLSSPGLQPPY